MCGEGRPCLQLPSHSLLPSAFPVLVELRPPPPQSYNTAKNLCLCQGWEGQLQPLGIKLLFTVICTLSCLSEERGRRLDQQSSGRYSWVLCWDQSENLNPSSLDPLLSALPSQSLRKSLRLSPKLCLHWWGRKSLGRGASGVGAKVGTFEAGLG